MARLKSQSEQYITLHQHDYQRMLENTIMVEALKMAGIEDMPIYKAMLHILENELVDVHIEPVSRRYL